MGTETNGGNFKREGRLMIVTTNVTSGCLRRLDLIHKRVESHKIRLHPDLLLGSLPTDQPVFFNSNASSPSEFLQYLSLFSFTYLGKS